jgi:hypothetical protein
MEFPPMPAPADMPETDRQARLQEEIRYWGGRLPSDRIRETQFSSREMAKLDPGLADAIAAVGRSAR